MPQTASLDPTVHKISHRPVGPKDAKIRWLFRCLTVALGSTQVFLARNTIGPDARSYLEIARAILRHDWAIVVNAYWSVLYPWLLALMLAIFKPSLRQEFPVAHALAIPVLLVCMAAFEFFWGSLIRLRESALYADAQGTAPISTVQMWALGYSFFIWLTVGGLITAVNPDLCMTTMALFTAGLVVRLRIEGNRFSLYVWFGLCLGLGYLVKAILFPMAFVFFAMAVIASGRQLQKKKWHFVLAFLIFAFIAFPVVGLLSHSKARFTFSDAGKLNFAWYTYDLPLRNWQGEPSWSGTPLHPTRKLHDHPAVYEFNGPISSSYPPWFDPSYWNDGLSPKPQPRVVIRHVLLNVWKLGWELAHPTAWVAALALLVLGCDLRRSLHGIADSWYLAAIAVVAFAAHCVTLLEGRYLAPWEILLWGVVLTGLRLRPKTARFYGIVTAIVSVVLLTSIARLLYGEHIHGFHNDASAEYTTAEGLEKLGLRPGTRVGAIGFDNDAYWAYLLRLNIVAEIDTDETCLFWGQPPATQDEILDKFVQAGASAVVAQTGGGIRSTSQPVPIPFSACAHPDTRWQKIPGSPNHIFFLK
jgi:hypothetical protein